MTVTDQEIDRPHPGDCEAAVGHVDNSAYPLIDVNISMTVVMPANAKGPVPVLMMFGRRFPAPTSLRRKISTRSMRALKALLAKRTRAEGSLRQYPAYSPIAPRLTPFRCSAAERRPAIRRRHGS